MNYETPVARRSRAAFWAGWIISVLPVLALFMSSAMKLAKVPAAVEGFKKFGYPEHLLLVLGIVELSCALIYLFPRTAVLGAILMTGYLGGAVATHVRIGDPGFVTPIICGVLVWLGLFLRDRRMRALVPLRG
jgi:uncharacterized membrane protein YhaH (DUF805 family)